METWFMLELIVQEDPNDRDNAGVFLPQDPSDWAEAFKATSQSYGSYCCAVSNNQQGQVEKSLLVQILPSVEEPFKAQGQFFGFSLKKEGAKKLAAALLYAADQLD